MKALWRLARLAPHVLHGLWIVKRRFGRLSPAQRHDRIQWWSHKTLRLLGIELAVSGQADPALKPGHAYMPMHWGSGYMAGDGVNALGNDAVDPLSHQPELKHSAVSVRPLDYAWQASAWMRGAIPELRPRLASWLRAFPYAVLVPSAIGGEGVRLRLAAPEAPQAAVLERLAADLELERPDMAFDDPARGVRPGHHLQHRGLRVLP